VERVQRIKEESDELGITINELVIMNPDGTQEEILEID